jgi:hypothetical protein
VTKAEFLKLMNFPTEWDRFSMYPDELFQSQVTRYQVGHEEASEHDRNGAFHWWLRRGPDRDQLEKLLRLTFLDPDPALGADVRDYIRRNAAFDSQLAALESQLQSID